jgi:hypothetical protein
MDPKSLTPAENAAHSSLQNLLAGDAFDRGARIQRLCEDVWGIFEANSTAARHIMGDFLRLLENKDDFALASLVIPELRQLAPREANPHKAYLLDRTAAIRLRFVCDRNPSQAQYDDRLYVEEKDIFRRAELHRAKLLFYERATTEQEMREIERWWENRPLTGFTVDVQVDDEKAP